MFDSLVLYRFPYNDVAEWKLGCQVTRVTHPVRVTRTRIRVRAHWAWRLAHSPLGLASTAGKLLIDLKARTIRFGNGKPTLFTNREQVIRSVIGWYLINFFVPRLGHGMSCSCAGCRKAPRYSKDLSKLFELRGGVPYRML